MLKDRQKSILDAVIQEHIRTARPVASRELTRGFRLGIGPATIRNEMLSLDRLGYLEQPHTSAGRIPTDKGYRFFVDNIAAESMLDQQERKLFDHIFAIEEEDEFMRELGKAVSHLAKTFTAIGTFDDNIFYETGFSEVLGEPEFQEAERIKTFGRLADLLDEEIHNFIRDFETLEEKIYIGEENPLREAHSCAMIFCPWKHSAGFSGFMAMLAPKRTDYAKHKALIRRLKNPPYER